MGVSTTQQLINKAKNENSYNNSGLSSDGTFIDFFNDALNDLVDDLSLEETLTINFVVGTREYDLPANFYALPLMSDANKYRVTKRRNYDQQYPPGYWVMNRGSKYIIDLYNYTSAQTFTGLYQRYPVALTLAGIATEKPEVATVGERALIYYALSKALRNNNQVEQAMEMEKKYESERLKIRTAAMKARGT
jgi:hypothetical protein